MGCYEQQLHVSAIRWPSSIYSDYLYTNNVKVYEISTSNYLHSHIVLRIYFRVHNLMMAI